jgi:hypothetical protein
MAATALACRAISRGIAVAEEEDAGGVGLFAGERAEDVRPITAGSAATGFKTGFEEVCSGAAAAGSLAAGTATVSTGRAALPTIAPFGCAGSSVSSEDVSTVFAI